jgi:AcrR family transcriptional regulator
MSIPTRILRARAQNRAPAEYALTARQQNRHEHIVATAQCLMSAYGSANIAFRDLAIALRMGSATLRFHFVDLDALLGEILSRHLHAVATVIGGIQPDAADPKAARRAAYLAYTRGADGGLTEAHLLLVRDRHLLPPDLLEGLEGMRRHIGELLAGDMADEALLLLDCPRMNGPRIEACLAALAAIAAPTAPKPIDLPHNPSAALPATPAARALPADWKHPIAMLLAPPRSLPKRDDQRHRLFMSTTQQTPVAWLAPPTQKQRTART